MALPGRPWTEDTYTPTVPGSVSGSVPTSPGSISGLDNVNSDDRFDYYLSRLEQASKNDSSALEKLFNYYATVKSEKTAREWTQAREDTQYQRLVNDLQKAGISPYIMSSAVPGVSSSTGASYSGSQMTSAQSNKVTSDTNLARSLISLVGTALIIALHFL